MSQTFATRPLTVNLGVEIISVDLRSGSIKRVASAVGEGSVCVQFIHTVISEDRAAGPR